MFRTMVIAAATAAAALLAVPAMAQATGPQGLAEPKALPKKIADQALATAKAQQELKTPPVTPENTINFALSSGGVVSIELRPDKAPLAVARLKTLAGQHFYDGLAFHRVIDGFMAQGGDPKGTGEGGSSLPDLKAEFTDLPHVRGAMAMARASGEDSANSQFYIVLSPSLSLDTHYTVVGRVFQGMTYVDKLEKGEPPANPSRILRAYIGAAPATALLAPQEIAALEATLPARPGPAKSAIVAPTTLAGSNGALPTTPAVPPAPRTRKAPPPKR